MKKAITLSIGVLFIHLLIPGEGHPAQPSHRPWLMIRSQKSPAVSALRSVRAKSRRAPLVSAPASTKKGRKIAERALHYKGTRYKFGGTTKKGMDCSGLVNRVYEDLKLKKIPRASNALFQSGQAVKMSQLRPGDLVFFKNTYRRGISHVGVYTGRNKFVHASNRRRGVTITALSDPYYQLHYAGARRLY